MKQLFKMVIIDDIPAVVNGIANNPSWKDHDIEIAGTASDGLDGLRLIDDLKPDIIITDIRMPKLSGIEMMEQVKQSGSKLIFISGYSDFNYAQQAMKLGGFDYILKPFTMDKLMEVVCKAKLVLEEERQAAHNKIDTEQKLRESMPLLRQEYLNLLVRYSSNPQRIKERWDFLDINMESHELAIFAVEIDDYFFDKKEIAIGEVELTRFAIQNIMEETLASQTKAIVFRDGINRFICIVNDRENLDLVSLAEKCRENTARYSRITVSIGVGTTVGSLLELPVSYQQAIYALTYNFYSGGNSVFAFPEYESNQTSCITWSSEKERELIFSLRSGASDKLGYVLEEVFGEWNDAGLPPSPEKVRIFCIELVVSLRNTMSEELVLCTEDNRFFDERLAEMTSHKASITKLQSLVAEICEMYSFHIRNKQKASAHMVINQSITYIRENLHMNESVADYARQAHLSTSYYSNLFKKVTGQSVLQFVVNERIEKAKLLISMGMPLHEIAIAVGYEERSYFSDVFKKKTGVSPSEFRRQHFGS